jgi:hypothetical protein
MWVRAVMHSVGKQCTDVPGKDVQKHQQRKKLYLMPL